MVRTWRPKKLKRIRTHGYRAMSAVVRIRRMRKGRKLLAVKPTYKK